MDEMMQPGAMQPEMPAEQGGYSIEIVVDAQGGIKVGVDSAEAESAEMGAEGEEQYKQVADINEALRLVKEIYSAQGQDTSSDTSAMEQGYK